MEPAGLRLAGVDCGFQSDRPDLGFLGLRHLAAKIQINSYWISLDFLGFSRQKLVPLHSDYDSLSDGLG
jgi:hypothetical protein